MEKEALEALYRKYQRELYLYLLSLCRREDLAEDLLQETFFRALLSLSESHGNFRAWLYRVARNLYLDQRKKEDRVSHEVPELTQGDATWESLLQGERARLLYRGLGLLEERKREILELQYFGGLSQKEIAALLHLRPDHVRVLAMRARREMRKWMEEQGHDLW